MTAPNMAAITASLERSFQNCSLNDHHLSASDRSSSSEFPDQTHNSHHLIRSSSSSYHSSSSNSDSTVELNSHVSLPYQWEQCLDLKTGEIYYQNWRNGMRANQDPRLAVQDYLMDRNDYYYNYYSDDDSSSYDSEGSSSESSPCSSRDHYNNSNSSISSMIKIGGDGEGVNSEDVLVVAGCKRCLMYLMLPKKVENCPQCRSSHLIHFDRSDNNSNHNNA